MKNLDGFEIYEHLETNEKSYDFNLHGVRENLGFIYHIHQILITGS